MSETITQNRIDYIVAIIQAADEGGVIQAGAMVHLFPGEPKRHTTTMLSHALSAAGVTREEMRSVARSEDSENESTALALAGGGGGRRGAAGAAAAARGLAPLQSP